MFQYHLPLKGLIAIIALLLGSTVCWADEPQPGKQPAEQAVQQEGEAPAAQPAVPQKKAEDVGSVIEDALSSEPTEPLHEEIYGKEELAEDDTQHVEKEPDADGSAEVNATDDIDVAAEANATAEPDGLAAANATDGDQANATAPTELVAEKPEETGILISDSVRSLTDIKVGHNESNPMWSPDGDMLAFERGEGDKREIIIAKPDGTIVQKIYYEPPKEEGALDFLIPGLTDQVSYNAGMSWSNDGRSLAFMSNGGSGNYDLYLLPKVGKELTLRMTEDSGKDSHPHWSPINNSVVFVSGKTGKAEIYTMDLKTKERKQLTRGRKLYLYPQWSPDGKQIAMIYGSNENHDIFVIGDVDNPKKTKRMLTEWEFDDLRPIWSPDGTKLAFYSNYNPQKDPKKWSLLVVDANATEPLSEEVLAASVVAPRVVPDIEQGPAWLPDSKHLAYVKNNEQEFNPIFIINIETKKEIQIPTGTKMNHDVTIAEDGTMAFRAQVEQWDHIYLAKLRLDELLPEETE